MPPSIPSPGVSTPQGQPTDTPSTVRMNGGGESSSVLTNGSHIGGGDSFAVKTESKPLFSSAVKSGSSSAATAMVVNGAGNGEMNGELNGELNGQFNNGEVKVVESEDPSNDLSGEITVIPVEG